MDIKILEYIIEIAEKRSISKAAESLYLSQPVLSRHLAKIENELGARLFIRRHSELELTDAGKIYLNNARAILYTCRQLEEELHAIKASASSHYTLLVDWAEAGRLAGLEVYGAEPGDISLKTELLLGGTKEALDALAAGLADMAVFFCLPDMVIPFPHICLKEDSYVLALPEAYKTCHWQLLSDALATQKDDAEFLLHRPLVLCTYKDCIHPLEQQILTAMGSKNLCYVNSMEAALSLASSGFGAALLPRSLVCAASPPLHMIPAPVSGDFQLVAAIREHSEVLHRLLSAAEASYHSTFSAFFMADSMTLSMS